MVDTYDPHPRNTRRNLRPQKAGEGGGRTHPSAQVASQRIHIRLARESPGHGVELAHVDLPSRSRASAQGCSSDGARGLSAHRNSSALAAPRALHLPVMISPPLLSETSPRDHLVWPRQYRPMNRDKSAS